MSLLRAAVNSFTGTLTSPKLIEPDHIERAISVDTPQRPASAGVAQGAYGLRAEVIKIDDKNRHKSVATINDKALYQLGRI